MIVTVALRVTYKPRKMHLNVLYCIVCGVTLFHVFNSPKAQVFSVVLAVAAFHLAIPCFYALTGINPHCHGSLGHLH